MNTQHTKFIPSFPKLNLSRKSYNDICNLAGYITDCPFSGIAILKLPDFFKSSTCPNIAITSTEERIVNHFANYPNEILVMDAVGKKLDTVESTVAVDTVSMILTPLQDANNILLGVISICCQQDKKWTDRQLDALRTLANQTVSLIELNKGNECNNTTFVDDTNITICPQTEIDGTATWKLNTATGCLDTNEQFYEILGHTPNSLQLKALTDWIEMVYLLDQDNINYTFQHWSKGKLLEKEVECRMLHKSGDIIFLNVKVNNTRTDLNGKLHEIEGEIQEISTQKTVWEQIELINPKQTSVIQAGYKWMAITELNGSLNYVNNILTLALGYSSEELIGKSFFDFIHESEREMIKLHFSKFLNNKPFVSKPFRIQHKKGTYKWVEIILVNLQEDPMINGIVVNARDITELIVKNKKIKSSEEKHRLLFNSSPYPKYILALDSYQIIDVNDAMISFYGYSRDEFMKMSALDLRPKKEIKNLLKGIKEFQLQSKTLNSGIYIHKKKNGELVKMDIVGQHISLNEKKCVLVTCTDVTDREQYLLQLKQSERKLKKATAIAKLGYWTFQINSLSLSCSEEVYNIFGLNIELTSIDFDTFYDAIHPKDKHLFIDTRNNKIANKRTFDLVFRILLQDNITKWVHLTGQLTIDGEGIPKRYQGTIQDITLQRKEEHKQRLLESVVTNTKEAVMVTEAMPTDVLGLRILYVNDAFSSMTGYSAEEILQQTPSILQGPKSDKKELIKLREAMERWEPCEITTINYKKNGEEFWVNTSLNPVADESGEYTHWISIARDVTKAKYQEIQKNLLIDIGVLFGHEKELKPCLINVLDYLTDFAAYTLGEIWLLNSENTHLKLVADYNKISDNQLLNRNRKEKLFSSGEGLVGATWEKQSIQVWEQNISTDIQVPEYPEVDRLGKLIGIPLTHKGQFIGALVIGLKEENKTQIFQNELFSEIANHIAAEIKRKLIEIELDHIINCAPDILCKTSADGYFKKINKSASILLGYSENELLSKKFIEFVHPEDQEKTLNLLSNLFRGNSYQYLENRFITKQGQAVWLSWSAKSNEEEGTVYAVAKDITENKELKSLLNEVTDLTLTGGWELNFKNSQIYWSDMTKKIHQVEPNYKPTIESILRFYKDGEAREIVLAVLENAILKGESWDLEIPIVTAKGQDRWVRMIGKPEFIKNQCTRIFGSFQDINDLKTSQFEMEKTNREKNNILESIGDAFISVDDNWTVNYCNAKASEVLNIDRKNIIGHNLWNTLKHQFSPKVFIKYLKPIKKGETIYFQDYFTFINKWLDISIYPTENTLSLYIRDISEKKLNQIAVEKQNERLREIAWTQSHVVRAPLARMLGIIDLLKEEELCEEEKIDLLGHIYSSATELDDIIKNIVHKSQLVIEIDKSNVIDKTV